MPMFLPGLHGLRALAALSVAIYHLVALAPNVQLPEQLGFVRNYSHLGVQLFFVLSAFSLAHSTFDRMNEPGWVRSFAIKRFFRIAPLFYVGICFFAIYDYVAWGKVHSISEYALNLLFVHNLAPGYHESMVWAGWTISVEMLFYALFPTLLALTTNVLSSAVLFVLACAIGIAAPQALAAIPGVPSTYPYMSLARALPAFAAGMLAFHTYRWFMQARIAPSIVRTAAILASVACIAGLAILPVNRVKRPDLILWALLFASWCVWQATLPGRFSKSKLMQFVGERSYSVYLVHAFLLFSLRPIFGLIHDVVPIPSLGFALCILVALACVLALAQVTYRLIEVPFITLGARIAHPSKQPVARTSVSGGLPEGVFTAGAEEDGLLGNVRQQRA